MIVLDPETGMVSACLDGTYLTQLRTGAVQGAATELLAKDAKIGADWNRWTSTVTIRSNVDRS